MAKFKLTLEYDGAGFSGWQRQEAHIITVQGVVEHAIARCTQAIVTLQVAGRTDAGVHALGQVAHFELTDAHLTPRTLRDAINFHVRPHPVAVLAVDHVDQSFHARFDALTRSYRYVILNRRAPPVLDAAYVWHIQDELDIPAMQAAACALQGQHDFTTFRAQHCQSPSPVKTLDLLQVSRDGEKVIVAAQARSFLYHQVRNMVGTLSLVGRRKWSHQDFLRALAARDRTKGGPTAPPQGLFFLGPTYPP